jgi:hypothetical protein
LSYANIVSISTGTETLREGERGSSYPASMPCKSAWAKVSGATAWREALQAYFNACASLMRARDTIE